MAEETKVRTYEPPEEFAREANVNDPSIYEEAEQDYEGFWAERARELHWFKEWDRVLDWDPARGPMVRRRQAQRLVQLPGLPGRAGQGRQDRNPLAGGRA